MHSNVHPIHSHPAHPHHNAGRSAYEQGYGQPTAMHYGQQPRRNPLTMGQWMLVGGAAILVGGVTYYFWANHAEKKAAEKVTAPVQNPRVRFAA